MVERSYSGPPLDTSWSNGPWDREGETVGGTTEDDMGNMTTENTPNSEDEDEDEDEVSIVSDDLDIRGSGLDLLRLLVDVVGTDETFTRSQAHSIATESERDLDPSLRMVQRYIRDMIDAGVVREISTGENGQGTLQITSPSDPEAEDTSSDPNLEWMDAYEALTTNQQQQVNQIVRYELSDEDPTATYIMAKGMEWTRRNFSRIRENHPDVVEGAVQAALAGEWEPPSLPDGCSYDHPLPTDESPTQTADSESPSSESDGGWKATYDSLTDIQKRVVEQVVRYRLCGEADKTSQPDMAEGFDFASSNISLYARKWPDLIDSAEEAARSGEWDVPPLPAEAADFHPTIGDDIDQTDPDPSPTAQQTLDTTDEPQPSGDGGDVSPPRPDSTPSPDAPTDSELEATLRQVKTVAEAFQDASPSSEQAVLAAKIVELVETPRGQMSGGRSDE